MADATDQLLDELSNANQALSELAADIEMLLTQPNPDVAKALDAAKALNQGLADQDQKVKDAVSGGGGGTTPPPAGALTADAGPDQNVAVGATVTLDASASQGPADGSMTYTWTPTGGPSAAALSDPNVAQPTFVADAAGVYGFDLVVHGGGADSAPDHVDVTAA